MSGLFDRLRKSVAARLESKFGAQPRFETLESRWMLAAGTDLTGAFAALTPDLTVEAGAATAVTVNLINQGLAIKKQPLSVDFYAFSSEEFDLEDAVLLRRVTSAIAFPQALPTSVTLPPSMAAGIYRFAAVIDATSKVAEDTEINNTIISDEFEVTQPDYDLTIGFNGPQSLPSQVISNTTVKGTVKVTVRNPAESTKTLPNGQKVAVSAYVRPEGGAMDGSDDIEITSKPTLVAVSKLAPGRSVNASVAVTIPPTLGQGPYEIIVKVDSTDLLAETDEDNNNTTNGPVINVADPFVDIAAISASETFAAAVLGGAKGNASVIIKNQGNVQAKGTATVTFFASASGEIDGSEVQIGQVAKTVTLNANATASITGSVTMPNVEEAADLVIIAVVSFTPTNGQADSEADNNAADSSPTTVAPAFVDIAVTEATETFAATAAGKVKGNISVTLKNQGNVQAKGNATIKFYASATGALDGSEVELGQVVKPLTLSANATSKITTSVTLPNPDVNTGYTLFSKVTDAATNGVNETNLANNALAAGTVNVTAVAPTLADLLGTMTITETNAGNRTGTFVTSTGRAGGFAWYVIPVSIAHTGVLSFSFTFETKPAGFVGSQNSLSMIFTGSVPASLHNKQITFRDTKTPASKGSISAPSMDGGLVMPPKAYFEIV